MHSVNRLKLERDQLYAILGRARSAPLPEQDIAMLEAALETLELITQELETKRTSIRRLRKMLFGSSSEKMRDVLSDDDRAGEDEAGIDSQQQDQTASDSSSPNDTAATEQQSKGDEDAANGQNVGKKKRRGHGRNGADAYTGARTVDVPHETLKSGDLCPECAKGKVYDQRKPGVIVRIVGRAPLQGTVYKLEKLRCNLCGCVCAATPPEDAGTEKYDETAASMIATLKYGSGMPFYRLEALQRSLGIPLPASTQWDIVSSAAGKLQPVFHELIRQAAQGTVLHNDDTTMKILELGKQLAQARAMQGDSPPRTGVFTTGIVSLNMGHEIALFFTGNQHAGENLDEVLKQRAKTLSPPIQMSDALSRNLPKTFETLVANCNAHARRKFVDVTESFPAECRHVLETLSDVYKNDAYARNQSMSPQERLEYHQAESGPLMAELGRWLEEQLEAKKVEPNSGLGEAIAYMRKHWHKLTKFLHVPGAPLDNNVCERALKKAILHRKNALFYKTENGARVGDIFMSLIYTACLSGVNPFDYLTALQKHAEELSIHPELWMPWNYCDAVARSKAA